MKTTKDRSKRRVSWRAFVLGYGSICDLGGGNLFRLTELLSRQDKTSSALWAHDLQRLVIEDRIARGLD